MYVAIDKDEPSEGQRDTKYLPDIDPGGSPTFYSFQLCTNSINDPFIADLLVIRRQLSNSQVLNEYNELQ